MATFAEARGISRPAQRGAGGSASQQRHRPASWCAAQDSCRSGSSGGSLRRLRVVLERGSEAASRQCDRVARLARAKRFVTLRSRLGAALESSRRRGLRRAPRNVLSSRRDGLRRTDPGGRRRGTLRGLRHRAARQHAPSAHAPRGRSKTSKSNRSPRKRAKPLLIRISWRRRESNPRPRSYRTNVYERSPRLDLTRRPEADALPAGQPILWLSSLRRLALRWLLARSLAPRLPASGRTGMDVA